MPQRRVAASVAVEGAPRDLVAGVGDLDLVGQHVPGQGQATGQGGR